MFAPRSAIAGSLSLAPSSAFAACCPLCLLSLPAACAGLGGAWGCPSSPHVLSSGREDCLVLSCPHSAARAKRRLCGLLRRGPLTSCRWKGNYPEKVRLLPTSLKSSSHNTCRCSPSCLQNALCGVLGRSDYSACCSEEHRASPQLTDVSPWITDLAVAKPGSQGVLTPRLLCCLPSVFSLRGVGWDMWKAQDVGKMTWAPPSLRSQLPAFSGLALHLLSAPLP